MEHLNKLENTPIIAKQGFIRSRMNKDNLFNLLFWVLVVAVTGTAELLLKMIFFVLVLPLALTVFLLAVYLVAKLNPVTFENDLYTSKSGRSFKQGSFWKGQYLMFLAIANFIAIFAFFILKGIALLVPFVTTFTGGILLIPILYCILKNIPVTVYFKKEAWFIEGIDNSSYELPEYESILSIKNMNFNPINSGYSGNIYHINNHRHKKH